MKRLHFLFLVDVFVCTLLYLIAVRITKLLAELKNREEEDKPGPILKESCYYFNYKKQTIAFQVISSRGGFSKNKKRKITICLCLCLAGVSAIQLFIGCAKTI